ncbi:putative membrane protein [Neocallimastix lanati (nom. inval.)]|jgi:uncharacterized membrane protein YgaE (UPF0421/DUF939 family)|uniref:Putative membrane protein n=1 Tax=Neocallimastix californiae TaxID=1754190 RepID=A0A1Y2BQX5_9FUNG|nr:putative membrane protein [Neocallimastix sp. JGI-2020a]ORY37146.1 putative membrane protein [Neocallimastix californiae]|eukprot:ORY37146.1 putative membrane protein [Neocallimastix californiae]
MARNIIKPELLKQIKQILFNTFKITTAAVLAILVAIILKLDFAVSAGIVAILSVQPTKKETMKTAIDRLLAFLAALLICWVCFTLLGFTTTVFYLYLAVFILVCQWRKWYSAMAMDSVLISHFLNFEKMGFKEIYNECLLFIIGVGFGILVNIYLHKRTNYIEELKTKTDELIKQALHRMSLRIMDSELPNYDGSCFNKLNESIFIAKRQAMKNFNNQFTSNDTYDTQYINMRENQTKVLQEMYKCAYKIKAVPTTSLQIASILEKVSLEYHKDNDVKSLLEELAQIREAMKTVPFPVTRSEFEDRANLFIMLERLQEFLSIKQNFMKDKIVVEI